MTGFILDHLWQSTLFAALIGLLTLALRNNSARIRHWLWFAASVKFLVPFAGLTALGGYMLSLMAPPISVPGLWLLQPVAQPFSADALTLSNAVTAKPDFAQIVTPLLLALWCVGSIAILVRWIMRWSHLQRVLREANDVPVASPVPIKMAPSLLEPGLVGIFHPVILLPKGIDERLSQEEMQAIVAHEMCHLHRRDNLLAATHMLVEALFWFHPLVWWVGARLNEEREQACDEQVLASGQSREVYAESILKVCQFYVHSPLDCAAGISGADLKKRMETIMESKFSLRLNAAKKLLLAGAAAIAIVAPITAGLLTSPPVFAQGTARTTQDPRSEAALRRQIDAFQKHQPAVDWMALPPNAIRAGQMQAEQQNKYIDGLGALKSITFKGVEEGADCYTVEFANAQTTWMIQMAPDGNVTWVRYRNAIVRSNPNGPEPGTEVALRGAIDDLSKPQPGDFAKGLLIDARMEKAYHWLGALKSLTFTRATLEGLDQFEAVYENGHATWTIGPLIKGKIGDIAIKIPFGTTQPGMDMTVGYRVTPD